MTDRPGIFSHIFLTLTQTDSQAARNPDIAGLLII
jgi:hypothetical protein